MIEIKIFDAPTDIGKNANDVNFSLSSNADYGEFGKPISELTISQKADDIKQVLPIINYANFFGDGLDLFDETKQFALEEDNIGYINPPDARNYQDNKITIDWFRGIDKDSIEGITIIFGEFSCKKAVLYAVDYDDVWHEQDTYFDEIKLPKSVYLKIKNIPEKSYYAFKIVLSDLIENEPINILGIVLGEIVELDSIKSFDMITETNPISDDLSINEANITSLVPKPLSYDNGQLIVFYDSEKILETGVIIETEENEEFYNIKSRNKLELLDKRNSPLFQYGWSRGSEIDYDWNNLDITVETIINDLKVDYNEVKIPDEIKQIKLSPFLSDLNNRKILQQVAWSTCCGVDTTYKTEINLIPFFAQESFEPDIIISNSDDRILKTQLKKGTQYSKIKWVKTKYFRENEESELGEVELRWNPMNASFSGSLTSDSPVFPTYYSRQSTLQIDDPYHFSISYRPEDAPEDKSPYTVKVSGYKYAKYEDTIEILLNNSTGETLEISNQTLYPLDDTKKIAQLRKWYTNNNTLTATVVDNDSEIQVGKIVKIQLKKGNYFQGVVTSIVRTNINDYHTVELEAHEWN